MDRIVIDADDFCESNHKLDVLERIHDATGMVFTLFTIPGLCSAGFIERVKKISWIDMVPHGWEHPHARECQEWDYGRSLEYLRRIAPLGLTRGFKAPGWQISDGMYMALLEEKYWVADQAYNNGRRPDGLRVHFPQAEYHFHIGHLGGYNSNEIELHIDRLMGMHGEFCFIKDMI